MRKAIIHFVIAAALLAGCASPENRAVLHYIKTANGYEQSLTDFKTQMGQVQNLPLEQRSPAFTELAGKVRARKAELEKVEVPAPAQKMQESLVGLYDVLARFQETAAHTYGSDSDELRQLTKEWQQKMKSTDDELTRLSARYQ